MKLRISTYQDGGGWGQDGSIYLNIMYHGHS